MGFKVSTAMGLNPHHVENSDHFNKIFLSQYVEIVQVKVTVYNNSKMYGR